MGTEKILEHDHFQHEDFKTFIQRFFPFQLPDPPADSEATQSVNAFINEGRWIVKCLSPECNSASLVSSIFKFYICPHCGNRGNGGRWLRVVFPPSKQSIEVLLLKRSKKQNRNWEIGQTVDDLLKENRLHGIE